ncbi:MAG: hypothetical protein HRU17_07165 [Polyangiaceae bacterium]|nr:hypothetical protein [Polyangiaceae bacterium]
MTRKIYALSALFALACGPQAGPPPASGPPLTALDAVTASSSIRTEGGDGRPRLSSVVRAGDPLTGIAVSVVHDQGSRVSAWLAQTMQTELARRGVHDVQLEVNALGYTASFYVADAVEANAAAQALIEAMHTPPANPSGLTSSLPRFSAGPQASLAHCMAEPYELEGATSPLHYAEQWIPLHSSEGVQYAIVGSSKLVDAFRTGLQSQPGTSSQTPEDPWPSGATVGVTQPMGPTAELSFAVRVADASSAVAVKNALSRPSSELRHYLAAVGRGWSLSAPAVMLRPRGACLSLSASSAGAITSEEAQLAATVINRYLGEQLASAPRDPGRLASLVLAQSDPRAAAAIAAWQTSSGRQSAGELTVHLAYSPRTQLPAEVAQHLGQQLASDLATPTPPPQLTIRAAHERGQGEIWALVASTCGTADEPAASAGARGLAMLQASRETQDPHVTLVPWVTPGGVGLMAHGPPATGNESAADHARRIGRVLGRALTAHPRGQFSAVLRAEVQDALGPGPRPDWWHALDRAAPHQPGALSPFGTWSSVGALNPHQILDAARAVATEPLRVAVIAPVGTSQAALLNSELSRALEPFGRRSASCPETTADAPAPGEYRLVSEDADVRQNIIVVSLDRALKGRSQEAQWTHWLLTRPGGWLERAVRLPGLAASAEAHLVGGLNRAALIIEINAVENRLRDASDQARGLLARLAEGALTAADHAAALKHFERVRLGLALDPRSRLLKLWRGQEPPQPPSFSALQKWQRLALDPKRHILLFAGTRAQLKALDKSRPSKR